MCFERVLKGHTEAPAIGKGCFPYAVDVRFQGPEAILRFRKVSIGSVGLFNELIVVMDTHVHVR